MKLNNKGFAISSILYGLLAVIIILLFLLFQIMRTNNNNNKYVAKVINNELNACSKEKRDYDRCVPSDCSAKFSEYKSCYCKKIYIAEKLCRQRLFGET